MKAVDGVSHSPKTANISLIISRMTDLKPEWTWAYEELIFVWWSVLQIYFSIIFCEIKPKKYVHFSCKCLFRGVYFKKTEQFLQAVNGVSHSPKTANILLIRSRMTDFKLEWTWAYEAPLQMQLFTAYEAQHSRTVWTLMVVC